MNPEPCIKDAMPAFVFVAASSNDAFVLLMAAPGRMRCGRYNCGEAAGSPLRGCRDGKDGLPFIFLFLTEQQKMGRTTTTQPL